MNRVSRLAGLRSSGWGVVVLLAVAFSQAHPARAWGAGPEIFSLDPAEGTAGGTIHVKGKGLKKTKQVLFVTSFTYKPAKFEVVADGELNVVAPDFWTADTRASVVIWTNDGLTVGLPPDTIRVNGNFDDSGHGRATYQVVKGGHISAANGTVLVEDGGTVVKSHQAIVSFVAKGGTLTTMENPAGILFYERGAILGQEMTGPPVKNSYACRTLLEVREIVPSLGIPEFVFQALPRTDDKPKSVPVIQSILPAYGYAGDIVTLGGKGFLGTTEVYFCHGVSNPARPASFRVDSDRVLKVEVPKGRDGDVSYYQYIVVINPLGATVTVPPPNLNKVVFHADRGNFRFRFVHAGETDEGSMHDGCFIEKGGLAEKQTYVAFVKSGGRLVQVPDFLLYEPGANIPTASDQKKKGHHEVPRLEASRVAALFYKMTSHDLLADGVYPRSSSPAPQKKAQGKPANRAKARPKPKSGKPDQTPSGADSPVGSNNDKGRASPLILPQIISSASSKLWPRSFADLGASPPRSPRRGG